MEFERNSSLEDLDFYITPCWVRVMKLPIGLMNKATGVAIGENLGTFLEVDAEEDELAIGHFLRVKILLDIRKPLQRGVTMELNAKGDKLWCPVVYEFLPNFCYLCGLLGHIDKSCDTGSWREKKKPYSGDLRVVPSRRRFLEESRGKASDGSGSGGSKWEKSQGSGSKQSWRNAIKSDSGSAKGLSDIEKGEESTSPLKLTSVGRRGGVPQKLHFGPSKANVGENHTNQKGPEGISSGEAANEDMGKKELPGKREGSVDTQKELNLEGLSREPKLSSAVQDPYQQDSVEEEMEIDGRKVVQQGKMILLP